jgi:hypothetical protein
MPRNAANCCRMSRGAAATSVRPLAIADRFIGLGVRIFSPIGHLYGALKDFVTGAGGMFSRLLKVVAVALGLPLFG